MDCVGVLWDTTTGSSGGAQDGCLQWAGPSSPSVLLWWDPGVLGLQVACPNVSPQTLSWDLLASVGSMSCFPPTPQVFERGCKPWGVARCSPAAAAPVVLACSPWCNPCQ